MEYEISPAGVIMPRKEIVRITPWLPTRVGAEIMWQDLEKDVRRFYDKLFKAPTKREKMGIVAMAGSLANYSSKKLQDIIFGATAYTAVGTNYVNLWAAAITDTFNGGTTSKVAYTSYAALALTNNTTIFAAGTGTTTYTKTWPSDAAKSWPTSTGTGTNNTAVAMGVVDGNAGTSGDNGICWCDVTSTTINNGDTPQLAQNAVSVVQD